MGKNAQIRESVRQIREKSIDVQKLFNTKKTANKVPLETRVESLENAMLEMILDD